MMSHLFIGGLLALSSLASAQFTPSVVAEPGVCDICDFGVYRNGDAKTISLAPQQATYLSWKTSTTGVVNIILADTNVAADKDKKTFFDATYCPGPGSSLKKIFEVTGTTYKGPVSTSLFPGVYASPNVDCTTALQKPAKKQSRALLWDQVCPKLGCTLQNGTIGAFTSKEAEKLDGDNEKINVQLQMTEQQLAVFTIEDKATKNKRTVMICPLDGSSQEFYHFADKDIKVVQRLYGGKNPLPQTASVECTSIQNGSSSLSAKVAGSSALLLALVASFSLLV